MHICTGTTTTTVSHGICVQPTVCNIVYHLPCSKIAFSLYYFTTVLARAHRMHFVCACVIHLCVCVAVVVECLSSHCMVSARNKASIHRTTFTLSHTYYSHSDAALEAGEAHACTRSVGRCSLFRLAAHENACVCVYVRHVDE